MSPGLSITSRLRLSLLDGSRHAQALVHRQQGALHLLKGGQGVLIPLGDLLFDDRGLSREPGEMLCRLHSVRLEGVLDVAVGGDGLVLP
jgi:hypothetical protein